MAWVMVEQDQGLYMRHVGQTNSFLPRRMSITFEFRIFRIGERGIVNDEIGVLNQLDNRRVTLAFNMFRIGDIAQ